MEKFYKEEELSKKILDLEVGDKFATKWRTMTQTDLELNAIVNGDYHPMFFSEEAAKNMGWKTKLFPGLVTLNIAIGLLIQSRRFELELVSKKQNSKKQWIIDYKFEVKNDKGEVCIEGYNC